MPGTQLVEVHKCGIDLDQSAEKCAIPAGCYDEPLQPYMVILSISYPTATWINTWTAVASLVDQGYQVYDRTAISLIA